MWSRGCYVSKSHWRGRHHPPRPSLGKTWIAKCSYQITNIAHKTVSAIAIFILSYLSIFFIISIESFFQCDGILCDGPSRENAISTVVDCRDIDNGNLAFFRIGLTPKSTILNIFETLLKKHGKMPKSNINGIIQVNDALEKEINV